MGEIGLPEKRRVLVPPDPGVVPNDNPYTQPSPQHEPAKVEPERVPEKVP